MKHKLVCALAVAATALLGRADTETVVNSTEGGYYEWNVDKTFPNVNLAYVKGARAVFLSSFGSNPTRTFELDTIRDVTDTEPGFYYWTNDGATLTAQLQQKCDGYMRGFIFQAVQDGADVKVRVIARYYPAYDAYGVDFRTKGQTSDPWYTSYIPDQNTDSENNDTHSAAMALQDFQLIVSDEPQMEVDDQWDGAESGVAAGDILTFNGMENGVGTWSSTAENWLTADGAATRWVKGCIARFASSGTVAVSNFKNPAGIIVAEQADAVTFTGSDLRLTENAVIRYDINSTVRFENAVSGGVLAQTVRDAEDQVASLEETVYLSLEEARKILPEGLSLDNLGMLSFMVDSCWGSSRTRVMTNEAKEGSEGVYKWEYDEISKVATCQVRVQDSSGVCSCVKVQFEERDDGIYAQGLYAKAVVGWGGAYTDLTWYDQNYSNVFEVDYDMGPYRSDAKLIDKDDAIKNYHVRIYGFKAVTPDVLPTNMVTEIAADLSVSDSIVISNGVMKTVGEGTFAGGGDFAQPISIGPDATLGFGSTTLQKFSSAVTGLTASKGLVEFLEGCQIQLVGRSNIKVPLTIAGVVSFGTDNYNGYERFYGCPRAEVLAGGVLNVSAVYYNYGHSGAKVVCQPGGVVNYLTAAALGSYDDSLEVNGGEAHFAADYTTSLGSDTVGKKVTLNDGARFTGEMMTWAWNSAANALTVGGSEPSSVELAKIRFGQNGVTASASAKNMVEKIAVADVTGDEAVDFTVSSTFYLNSGTDWSDAAYCGIEKSGAGTMLLTAADSTLAGTLWAKEGTVAFGSAAGLTGMALCLQGGSVDFGTSVGTAWTTLALEATSSLAAERNARVTFDDSSAVEWADGAELLITGRWGAKAIRVGTSADALTATQLAAIKGVSSDGRTRPVTISTDGYLICPWGTGLTMVVR